MSTQVGILPGTGQQRLDVFEQRRHDQLVAVQAEGVEHLAAQVFDLARFRRQYVGDILRQKPVRHGQQLWELLGMWQQGAPVRDEDGAESAILPENGAGLGVDACRCA
jgi:hypothetical protein